MKFRARSLLSATDFAHSEITEYARDLILPETRLGLLSLTLMLLALQTGIWILEIQAGNGPDYFNTFCLLTLLSAHMLWSVRHIRDTHTLHVLAMTYVVMYAMAIALVAHKTGSFDIALMASAVMLMVAVPLVPWGLREAGATALLIYVLFTASSVVVSGRFSGEVIWTLQFLFVTGGAMALVLVARNVRVRKDDIEARFELEQAQRRHEHLSLVDPLTGAFNRRYLDRHYGKVLAEARASGTTLQLALLDVDNFKILNDTAGHHGGDDVLRRLVDTLGEHLPGSAIVVRLGGDEFAVLLSGSNVRENVLRCLKHLETDPAVLRSTGGKPVTVSAGFAPVEPQASDLEDVYRIADEQLYAAKRNRPCAPEAALDTAVLA